MTSAGVPRPASGLPELTHKRPSRIGVELDGGVTLQLSQGRRAWVGGRWARSWVDDSAHPRVKLSKGCS